MINNASTSEQSNIQDEETVIKVSKFNGHSTKENNSAMNNKEVNEISSTSNNTDKNKQNPMASNIHEIIDASGIGIKDNNKNIRCNNADYNIVIKVVLILMMVSSCFNLFSQLMTSMIWHKYSWGLCQFIGGLINLFAFFLIYKKNIWGIIIFFLLMILQVPLNNFLGTDNFKPIYLSALIRIVIVVLILCIRSNGQSGWKVLLNNADFSLLHNFYNTAFHINLSNESPTEVNPNYGHQSGIKQETSLSQDNSSGYPNHKTDSLTTDDLLTNTISNNSNISSKQNRKPRNKYILISSSIILLIILTCCFLFFKTIMSQKYPDYVEGIINKIYFHYDWANNELNSSLIEKANNAKKHDLDDLSKQYMEAAATIKTTDINALITILEFFDENEDYKRVKEISEKAISLDPNESKFYALSSKANLHVGNRKDVVRLAQKALEIDSQTIDALITLSHYYYQDKDYANCLKWTEKWSASSPNNAKPYYLMAKCYYELGDKDHAVYYYNKGVEVNPNLRYRSKVDYIPGPPFQIQKLDVANVTYNDKVINNFGSNFYDDNTQYFKLRATVKPLRTGSFMIYIKLFYNGELNTGDSSPRGYTYSKRVYIYQDRPQTIDLGSWGADSPGHWNIGAYRYEIWFGDEIIGSKSFNVYNAISWKFFHKNEF